MQTVLLVVHVLIAISLIGMIMIQHGKGADMGAAFGSGASSTVFGARGAGSFMTRVTATLAMLFFVTSLTLAFLASRTSFERSDSVIDRVEQATPATPQVGSDDLPVIPEKAGQ